MTALAAPALDPSMLHASASGATALGRLRNDPPFIDAVPQRPPQRPPSRDVSGGARAGKTAQSTSEIAKAGA
jgi:hypothetical protein